MQLCDRLAIAIDQKDEDDVRVGLTMAALSGVDSLLPLLAWKQQSTTADQLSRVKDGTSVFLTAVAREDFVNKNPKLPINSKEEFRKLMYGNEPQWYADKMFELLDETTNDGVIDQKDAAVAAVAYWLAKQEEPMDLNTLTMRVNKLLNINEFPIKGLDNLINIKKFSDWIHKSSLV